MSQTIIERATPDDLDVLEPLFEAYRAFYRLEPRTADARTFLTRRLASGDSTILIARLRGTNETVGFVQLYRSLSSLALATVWILNDLYVKPDVRGHGVGRQLMLAAHQLALDTAAVRVELETAPDNLPARMLYESLGYRSSGEMLHYSLVVNENAPVA